MLYTFIYTCDIKMRDIRFFSTEESIRHRGASRSWGSQSWGSGGWGGNWSATGWR